MPRTIALIRGVGGPTAMKMPLLREVLASAPDPSPQPVPEAKPAPTYTFADVRRAFSAKSHEGFTDQVRDLIRRYGADKLSSVKEADYPALMAELEAIG